MTLCNWYANAPAKAFGKEIDFGSDAIYAMLLASGYSPDLLAHDYENDLTNELSTGGGYTAGGLLLTGCALTVIPAASAPAWTANTAYKLNQIVRKVASNGHIYRCVVAGTSHVDTEPTWPTTPGATVEDGTATWAECGRAYLKFDSDDPTWEGATFTCRYLVLVNKESGSAATNPLLLLVDFESDQSVSGADFAYVVDSVYGYAALAVE